MEARMLSTSPSIAKLCKDFTFLNKLGTTLDALRALSPETAGKYIRTSDAWQFIPSQYSTQMLEHANPPII